MNTKSYRCPKCGQHSEMFYCPNCGTILRFPSFIGDNEKRKLALQEFINKVITVAKQQKLEISSAIDDSSIRKAIYRKYYERIAYLQKLCSNKTTHSYFMNSGIDFSEQINMFAEQCERNECQIAVVGTVKAGKSAFINSLIGKVIASSYPTPETASVTKFRKSEKGDYVKISFYKSSEWNDLWKSVEDSTSNDSIKDDEKKDFLHLYKSLCAEEIRLDYLNKQDVTYQGNTLDELKEIIDKFTSARYPEHFFAKEVEVGLNDFFAPSNVVIVDTPGLDDPVPYRTDITRAYLHKANVVLLCKCSDKAVFNATELKQTNYIFSQLRYNKDRIITIGTQIDKNDDMLVYWDNHTLPEYLKFLSHSTLYGSKDVAEKHLFPISAFYFLYIKEAIDNPRIFLGKCEEDRKLRKKIDEIVRRYYDCPEKEDLVFEFGEEEANRRYRSPRQIFEEHKEDLLNLTQVPIVRNMLLNGPINKANEIILCDIKNEYLRIIKEIQTVSSEIALNQQRTISLSEKSDIAQLKKSIALLEKNISKAKKEQREQSKKLSELLYELECKTKKALNDFKS